jgi:hypothetical protein
MSDARFFGYGSLVNRATHAYPDPRPARLEGWRRVWVHTDLRPVAYLSVEPAEGEILGLVAEVPGGDWAALDRREAAYDRHPVTTRLHACGTEMPARVYAVPRHHAAPPDSRHPVLLSYIDTVVQGFLEVFGREGAAHFFETTAGWGGPVTDDRAAPRYPRATALTPAERAIVDAGLAGVTERA